MKSDGVDEKTLKSLQRQVETLQAAVTNQKDSRDTPWKIDMEEMTQSVRG